MQQQTTGNTREAGDTFADDGAMEPDPATRCSSAVKADDHGADSSASSAASGASSTRLLEPDGAFWDMQQHAAPLSPVPQDQCTLTAEDRQKCLVPSRQKLRGVMSRWCDAQAHPRGEAGETASGRQAVLQPQARAAVVMQDKLFDSLDRRPSSSGLPGHVSKDTELEEFGCHSAGGSNDSVLLAIMAAYRCVVPTRAAAVLTTFSISS
jgi:hypothetical protein